jgi:hypothetical protein
MGCDANCDVPLKDCDEGRCAIASAYRLTDRGCFSQTPEPLSCMTSEKDEHLLITNARAPDGSCWRFPNDLLPRGFVPGCNQGAMWCRESSTVP